MDAPFRTSVRFLTVAALLSLTAAALADGPNSQRADGASSQSSGDGEPKLPCPECIPDPGIPIDSPELRPVHPLCGVKEGLDCCAEHFCGAGLRCVTERHPVQEGTKVVSEVEHVCRKAAPPRTQDAYSSAFDVGGGLFGEREERVIGGACPTGTKRTRCSAKSSGSGQCFAVDGPSGPGWVSDSDDDCRCKVHVGVPAFQSVSCQVDVLATHR